MPNRPAISRDVTRRILIESGHRCAVCGESCPLEKAHIIPWSKSKQHDEENLICLCANCHQRADTEKWGEATLKDYKKKPWVMRRLDPEEAKIKSLIKISIAKKYENFSSTDRNLLIYGLAHFLGIPPEEITVEKIENGSTKIYLKLPKESGEKLLRSSVEVISEALKGLGPVISTEDFYHDTKRILSFEIFDHLIDSCMASKCPKITPELHRFLIDISVEGYAQKRAYFYYLDQIGVDDKNRYFKAVERGTRMLHCPVERPCLENEIFEIETDSLRNRINREGSIRRKSYWRYLSQGGLGAEENNVENSFEAEMFVERIEAFFVNKDLPFVRDSLRKMGEIIENHLNMASALDMYKYCYFRQCLKSDKKLAIDLDRPYLA